MEVKDILEAVSGQLSAVYPERLIHFNDVSEGFKRPCFLIELIKNSIVSVNVNTQAVTQYLTITCFQEKDGYRKPDMLKLLAEHQEVILLFRSGKLQVGDRFLNIQSSAGGTDRSTAFVDLQINYQEAKELPQEHYELMEQLETRLNLKG